MAAINTQMLTLMQDLSGWVLAGRCADAAAALGRFGEIQPAFAPWAVGASAIAGLPSAPDLQKRGMLQLLTSRELIPVLATPSPAEIGPLTQAFRIEGHWGLLGAEQALCQVVEGIAAWEPAVLRSILSGVIEAGGLADVALTIEKVRGGLSGRNYGRARGLIHELTSQFVEGTSSLEKEFVERIPSLSAFADLANISEGARQYLRSQESTQIFREIILISGLYQYLHDRLYVSLTQSGQILLTDLLQISKAQGPASAGRCLPTSILTAHIAHAAGVGVDALSHNCAHLSLSLRGTSLIIGTTPYSSVFRTEDDWKSMGLLGLGQRPGPLTDLLGGYVNAVSGLDATKGRDLAAFRDGLDAALKIAPNHFTTLLNRAYLERDKPELTRRMVERLSRLDPNSPWLPFLEAYILTSQGRREEAKAMFELALKICRKEGLKRLDNETVLIVTSEAIELALEDFIALCVADGDLMRASVQLAQFSNYPDEGVRNAVLLLMMALRGGGPKA
jgi:hypothetical protein